MEILYLLNLTYNKSSILFSSPRKTLSIFIRSEEEVKKNRRASMSSPSLVSRGQKKLMWEPSRKPK